MKIKIFMGIFLLAASLSATKANKKSRSRAAALAQELEDLQPWAGVSCDGVKLGDFFQGPKKCRRACTEKAARYDQKKRKKGKKSPKTCGPTWGAWRKDNPGLPYKKALLRFLQQEEECLRQEEMAE